MLKIRIILMSALFLLLVGVDMNVRASIDSAELVQESTDKEQSDKGPQQQESEETISHLDFFSAFSLVNTQLQWRDFNIGLIDEITEVESSVNRKELSLEEVKTLPFELRKKVVPSSPITNSGHTVVPVSTYRTISGKAHFICYQNKQRSSTIAYILNCGTYPLIC